MREVKSTIVYRAGDNNYPQRIALLKEAERAASIGGDFSIRHFYSDTWYEEFVIRYPETEQIK